jgi:hypothetical protein
MIAQPYTRRQHQRADPPHYDVPANRRLASLRTRAGLDPEPVAARFGLHPDRLRDIEDGWEPAPPTDLLYRWARWLEDQASPGWESP